MVLLHRLSKKDHVLVLLMITIAFTVGYLHINAKLFLDRALEGSKYSITDDEDPCGWKNSNSDETSLLKLAKKMANLSSPKGSASWRKIQYALSQTDKFVVVDEDKSRIFSHTTQNMIDLLEGYGLTQVDFRPSKKKHNYSNDKKVTVLNKDEAFVMVEYSYYIREYQNDPMIGINCVGDDPVCLKRPRILIQAEQIPGQSWLQPYLVKCHESPTCLIWDFSDSNLEWYNANNIADSVLLIPIMFHDRFKKYLPVTNKPIWNRSYDVVMFGSITQRRKSFWNDKLSNYEGKWNIRYGTQYDIPDVARTYADAKICLALHSYDSGGGEYHRLSEINQMGCIPVMETFTDKFGMDLVSQCGGVVFADYDDLIPTIEQILESNSFESLQDKTNDAIRWWSFNVPIKWTQFLASILGPRTSPTLGNLY